MASARTSILLLVLLLVLVLGGMFVMADYFGLFGLRERTTADFFSFRVQTVDADTGQRIGGVVVRCFQHGRQNVCTQTDTGRYGELNVMLPLQKVTLESLLFRRSEVFVLPEDTEVRTMYIHPDYQRVTEFYRIDELIEQPGRVHAVAMHRMTATDDNNYGDDTHE